jgi:uncharacterized protein
MSNTSTSSTNRHTALVTGASGGIGAELARELAAKGHNLVLAARSTAQLETLAAELQTKHSISAQIVTVDLGKPGAGHALAAELKQRGLTIDVLVNNAGYADFGNLWEADAAKIDGMLTLNMGALTELMHDLIPGMVSRKQGRVLNVASTAAFMPGPLMAVYYASKAYVLSLSEATNEELQGTGVTVSALCPGPTESGFQAAAAMEKSKLVKGKMMSTTTVAEVAIAGMLKGKPVIIPGFKNKLQALTPKLTPRRLIPGFVKKAQAASH